MAYLQAGAGIVADSDPVNGVSRNAAQSRGVEHGNRDGGGRDLVRQSDGRQVRVEHPSDMQHDLIDSSDQTFTVYLVLTKSRRNTMILVIDNYDSFTYNFVQYLGELGAEMTVRRNDEITLDEIRGCSPRTSSSRRGRARRTTAVSPSTSSASSTRPSPSSVSVWGTSASARVRRRRWIARHA